MIRRFRRTMGRRLALVAAALLLGAAPLAAQDVYLPQEALGPGATPGMAPAQGPMTHGPATQDSLMQGPGTQVYSAPMWPDGAAYQDAHGFIPEKPTPAGWRVEVGIVPLFYDAYRTVPFVTVNNTVNNTPNTLVRTSALSTRDIDFEFEAGSRSLIGKQIDPRHSIEFAWQMAQDWTDTAFVRNDDPTIPVGNLFSILSDYGRFGATVANPNLINGTPGLDFIQTASLSLRTSFETAEFNLRQKVVMPPGPVTIDLLYGARYFGVSEDLVFSSISTTPAGAGNTVAVQTDNKLGGFQLGGVSHYTCVPGAWWFDFEVKGALLQNMASRDTLFTRNIGGAASAFPLAQNEDRTSFMGDVSLLLNVQITPTWWFRLGYQSIWLTGVALAAENVPNANALQSNFDDLDHSGQVVYHGPQVGIGAAW